MKTIDGLNSYDILRMPECPIKLPRARSMTQAKLDFEHLEDSIIEWYKNHKFEQKKKQFKKQIREDPFDVW